MQEGFLGISHQGGADEQAANTLAALQDAVSRGLVPDVDLHLSRDGRLVMHHDPEVNGMKISETDWAELSKARIPAPDGTSEPLATFEELLARFPGQPASVEVKSMEAAQAMVDLVKARPELLKQVIFYAFSDKAIDYIRRELGPEAITGLGTLEGLKFLAYSKLPQFVRDRIHYRPEADILAPPATLGEFGPISRIPILRDVRVTTGGLVDRAHESGMKVIPWTVDEQPLMKEMIADGADGLYTDAPSVLVRELPKPSP
jgi:glycerophosphoryl diester phosphodiesterase